jgi:replicative DNA helicase
VSARHAPRPQRAQPYDEVVERAFLGGCVVFRDRAEQYAPQLDPGEFYIVMHQAVWAALASIVSEGGKVDAPVVADRARAFGAEVTVADVLALEADALAPSNEHVRIIKRHAAARQALAVLAEVRASIDEGKDPYAIAQRFAAELDAIGIAGTGDQPEAMTMPELVARSDERAPWVVPGLLRSDWRCLAVAPEGAGKSTLLRQIGICSAQGIDPLRFTSIPPVRVLVVDAENALDAIRETGEWLDAQSRRAAGAAYDSERFRVWSRPGGLDLRTPHDRAALVRELRVQRPQLVCAGPLYKLGRRQVGESYEDAAEGLQHVFDDLRTRFGFALLLEHHAPKAQGGVREMAPFGSQRWQAWPELGIGLYAERDGNGLRLRRFRGDRMASEWPDRLVRGDVWPFTGVWDGKARARSRLGAAGVGSLL